MTALLFGENVKGLAGTLGRYGAHKVIVAEHETFKHYTYCPHFVTVSRLVEERKPLALLMSATRNGRDLAGRLAVKFKTCLMAHIITLDIDSEGRLVGGVPGFGGSILAIVRCTKGSPQMATVSPGIFKAEEKWGEPEVEEVEPPSEVSQSPVRIVERKVGEYIDLSRSERVVIAGMGTRGDLTPAKMLCEAIRADLGVTRPLADMGVAPRDIQVGTTGVSLKAKLAIVLGASGAPHFVSGPASVKKVIAINKGPNAPMKDYSDYYAVADLFEVVPLLVEKLKKLRG